MKIQIWSDIACPFCYLGLKKLQLALDTFENKDKVEIVWHSYELNPDLPMEALEGYYSDYLAELQDVSEREVQKDLDQIAEQGKSIGLTYDYEKLVYANTSKALRLVKLASKHSLGTQAEETLFEAYFSKGLDISKHETLLELGAKIGLDEKEVKQMLGGDMFVKEVKEDTRYADEELKLEFIPYFIFNNEHIIQGTISTEEFKTTLEKSFKEWTERGESDKRGDIQSGQSCSIDGVCS